MDMTSIAAAQASFKAVLGIARATAAAVVDHELKSRLIEIQEGILDAQARFGDAQAERLDLLEQNANLREVVRRLENKQATLAVYKLEEMAPGKYLYRFCGDDVKSVPHFACPKCYNAETVTVLQFAQTGVAQTKYACQTCKFLLTIGPSDPSKPIQYRSPYRGAW
jgi:hypothetical protein